MLFTSKPTKYQAMAFGRYRTITSKGLVQKALTVGKIERGTVWDVFVFFALDKRWSSLYFGCPFCPFWDEAAKCVHSRPNVTVS